MSLCFKHVTVSFLNIIEYLTNTKLLTKSSLKLLNISIYYTSNNNSCLRLTMLYPFALIVTLLAICIVCGLLYCFSY